MPMHKFLGLAVGLGMIAAMMSGCFADSIPKSTPIPETPGWKLVWNDEFDGQAGAQPDPAKWGYDLGGQGWGNKELEYYTDLPQNAAMNGEGSLAIQAVRVEDPSSSVLSCWYGSCQYTS